jgi:hypothetical protein
LCVDEDILGDDMGEGAPETELIDVDRGVETRETELDASSISYRKDGACVVDVVGIEFECKILDVGLAAGFPCR